MKTKNNKRLDISLSEYTEMLHEVLVIRLSLERNVDHCMTIDKDKEPHRQPLNITSVTVGYETECV